MGMRIVSWNCAMGYAKKRWLVEALQPDVAVLPEVSQKHIAETDAPFKAWVGSNPHKGLGVIGFTGRSYILHEAGRLLPWHIPFIVDGVNIVADVGAFSAYRRLQQQHHLGQGTPGTEPFPIGRQTSRTRTPKRSPSD
jgi:hypothetical protein